MIGVRRRKAPRTVFMESLSFPLPPPVKTSVKSQPSVLNHFGAKEKKKTLFAHSSVLPGRLWPNRSLVVQYFTVVHGPQGSGASNRDITPECDALCSVARRQRASPGL